MGKIRDMKCIYGDYCWSEGVGCDHAYAHSENRMCYEHNCWKVHENPRCKKIRTATDWMSEKI